MATTYPSRIFPSGDATTLYVTIPAADLSASQFPFDADDDVTITIDGDRLIMTEANEGGDE